MVDFTELKQKQKIVWGLGEYDRIADGLHSAGEHVVRAARIRPGEKVLDVACGTGNTAIKARWRQARVTGLDLTPELLRVANARAAEEGCGEIDFREGDAENMPFADGSFDVVVSSCGHQFAPDQPKVAAEIARVTRPGGRIALHAWSPEGGLGRVFAIHARYSPPPPGVPSPFTWGDADKAQALLGPAFRDYRFERGDCTQYADRPEEIMELFTQRYGPSLRIESSLARDAAAAFRDELTALFASYRSPADGKVRWGREYIVTLATRE